MKGWDASIIRGKSARYVVIYVSRSSGRVRVYDRGNPSSEYRSFQTFLNPEDAIRGGVQSYRSTQEAKAAHPRAKRTKRFDLPAIKVRFCVSSILKLIEADGDARCMGENQVKAEQVVPSLKALLADEWMPKGEIEILPLIKTGDDDQ